MCSHFKGSTELKQHWSVLIIYYF